MWNLEFFSGILREIFLLCIRNICFYRRLLKQYVNRPYSLNPLCLKFRSNCQIQIGEDWICMCFFPWDGIIYIHIHTSCMQAAKALANLPIWADLIWADLIWADMIWADSPAFAAWGCDKYWNCVHWSIWASTPQNLSSEFLTNRDSNQSPQLQRLARKLKFRW